MSLVKHLNWFRIQSNWFRTLLVSKKNYKVLQSVCKRNFVMVTQMLRADTAEKSCKGSALYSCLCLLWGCVCGHEMFSCCFCCLVLLLACLLNFVWTISISASSKDTLP